MENTLPVSAFATRAGELRELYSPDYLLLLPLQGTICLKGIEETRIPQGTLTFLAPFSGRKLYLEEGCSLLYATISASFLESMIGMPKASSFLILKDDSLRAAERLVRYFDLCNIDPDATYLQKMGACFDLLEALEFDLKHIPAQRDTASRRGSQFAAYLEAHFRESLQLSDLAEAFGVTRQHISTLLHKELGVPFSAYLLRLRLNEALRLLLTTDKNITTISEESGFPNLRSFNVAFREQYGCSPKEYRKNRQTELAQTVASRTEAFQGISALLQPYRMVYQRSEEAVSVSDRVKADVGTAYAPVWQDTINVDNSADLLQSLAQEQLRNIQKEFPFRYVRLANILCHDLTPFIASTGQHRLTMFFHVVDFIRELGLTPMIVFGDSYSVLPDSLMFNEGGYSLDPEQWHAMLSSVLDACIVRWGKSWVSRWRFEFRMPGQLHGQTDPMAFMTLFERSLHLIKSKLPTAEVGGPAIPLTPNCADRWSCWLSQVQARNIPVDFVSTELWADFVTKTEGFPGQFGEWKDVKSIDTLLNADADLAVRKAKNLRVAMEHYGISAKLYISALGITKYQAMAAQIGGHCGAYLVKSILELHDMVDSIGCWKAVNQEAEYPNEYSVFGNGCGLTSRYGLKNPSWHAYQFLSRLYPRLLFRTASAFVTTDGNRRFAILIHNCKNYSEYFRKNYLTFKGCGFQESSMYTSNSALNQTMILSGISAQRYLVRQYLIGDHHGNIATVLKELGFLRNIGREEVEYLAGQSLPYQHAFHMNVEEELKLSVTLQPNEVMLLMISPEELP